MNWTSLNNSVKKVFNMNCMKLCLRYKSYQLDQKHKINRKILNYFNIPRCCSSTLQNFLLKFNDNEELFNKIIYNDVLGHKKIQKNVSNTFEPLCLKYLLEKKNAVGGNAACQEDTEKPEIVHFPYEPRKSFLKDVDENITAAELFPQSVQDFTPSDKANSQKFEWTWNKIIKNVRNIENPNKWTSGLETDDSDGSLVLGSYHPKKAVSSVPCGGCGALLHCNDPSIPGFIPLEIFENASKEQLQGELCQRCIFLRKLDIALGVNIKDSEYSKVISAIKEKEAMVLLMIDLLDFPCSIYPGILDLFGPKPVVIVGNKVDLLIQEGPECLSHIRGALISSLQEQKINLENVKYISLISAKTGYGLENLIDVLNRNWAYRGDIYLVGCTNAGKSTLFNALVQSDFCKIKAADLLHKATVSTWPGTTLNLIKFPITKPTESRMVARLMRLKRQGKEIAALEKLQGLGQNLRLEQIPLKGFVTRTVKKGSVQKDWCEAEDSFNETTRKGINPADPDFAGGKWFYDTPGVVHRDQIVNLLTTAELMMTVPKKMLFPRNFHLKPGHTLFIGGLARLDYLMGANFVWFTVFASSELPITVTKLEDADYIYEKLLGSPLFVVPMKGEKRLSKWPKLSSKKFEIVGKLPQKSLKNSFSKNELSKEADADVILSSAGWVTINVPLSYRCLIEAWTPEARGIYLRKVPLIRKAYTFRGKRIPGTPAFTVRMKEVEGYSVTDEPPS